MINPTIKSLFRSTLYSSIVLLIWMALNAFLNGSFWDGMTISKSAITVEYCEFNHVDKLFHQPMNTYSNIVYFFYGVLILQFAFEDYKQQGINTLSRLQSFPMLSALMGVCFIYLSIGSAFFHASLTWMGQRVDMNGTYSISFALITIGLYHVFYKKNLTEKQKQFLIAALSVFILAFYPLALMVSSSILLPILILVMWILIGINYIQFRKERSLVLAILSFVFIVVALKIRSLDVQKVGCDPFSLYQGHALWHLLTGTSSFCSYIFFRSTN